MTVFKRGRIYWYKFLFRGTAVCESTKQSNASVAREIEAAHRSNLSRGMVGIREKKAVPSFEEFCITTIEPYAKLRGKWTWYRSGIRALLKYDALAAMPLDEIRSEHAIDFATWRLTTPKHSQKRSRKHAPKYVVPGTINTSLRVLRRILRFAVQKNVIEKAPKIELLPGESRRERVITPADESAYLAKCTPLLRDDFTVLVDTGLRPDELHRMEWPEISWPLAGKRGSILVLKGKSDAARRRIPMTPRVVGVLQARWHDQGKPTSGWIWPAPTKEGHVNHSTVKKQHRNALKTSKVTPFVLYSARHTFLTRLGASGCDVWTLMRIAGHSSISMSMRYVHPHAETIDRAFAGLPVQAQLERQFEDGREKVGTKLGTVAESRVFQSEGKSA